MVYKDKSYSFTSQLSRSTPYGSEFSPSIKIGKTPYKPGKVYIADEEYNGYTAERAEKWAYVEGNLIAKGLCAAAEDWPFRRTW